MNLINCRFGLINVVAVRRTRLVGLLGWVTEPSAVGPVKHISMWPASQVNSAWSVVIRLWVCAVSTSESRWLNNYTMWSTSSIAMVSQRKLVSGWGLKKRKSTLPCESTWIRKDFTLFNYLRRRQSPEQSVHHRLSVCVCPHDRTKTAET